VCDSSDSDDCRYMYDRMCMRCLVFIVFFFFQAEDGIRDRTVTGVQTYALPIFTYPLMAVTQEISARLGRTTGQGLAGNIRRHYRSEERRVGKECRCRWGPDH